MFAVAAIFNVVSSGAFLLTQETRHLSTEHKRHRVRLQKQLDETHARTRAPGRGLNQLFHLNRIKRHSSAHKSVPTCQRHFSRRPMLHCEMNRLKFETEQTAQMKLGRGLNNRAGRISILCADSIHALLFACTCCEALPPANWGFPFSVCHFMAAEIKLKKTIPASSC